MKQRLDRNGIAKRAAKELKDGDYVNLGLGIPNHCADYADEGVIFHTENGAMGYGPLVAQTSRKRQISTITMPSEGFGSLRPGCLCSMSSPPLS